MIEKPLGKKRKTVYEFFFRKPFSKTRITLLTLIHASSLSLSLSLSHPNPCLVLPELASPRTTPFLHTPSLPHQKPPFPSSPSHKKPLPSSPSHSNPSPRHCRPVQPWRSPLLQSLRHARAPRDGVAHDCDDLWVLICLFWFVLGFD